MRIAFIGTGPLSLLKAYILGKANPTYEIVLYDENERIGGAWYSETSPLGYEIECGCHIWSYSPEVYSYIENNLGVELKILQPGAIFVGNSIRFPYSLKNSIDTYKFIAKKILKLQFGKLAEIKSNPALHTKIIKKRNKYPPTGSPALANALVSKLSELPNIEIKTGIKIEQIHANDKINLIFGGDHIEAVDNLYLTSVSDIERIVCVNKTIDIRKKRVEYVHFLIQLNKPLLKKLFYWRIISDEVIHRMSDISYQTENKENLLLIGIKDNAFHAKTEGELLNHCILKLKRFKLIDESFDVEKIKTHVFPTFYIDEKQREEISNLVPKEIKLMHSTDMMYGMYHLLKEEGLLN